MGRLIGIAWREKPRQPMIEAQARLITPDRGIEGDFRGAPGKRQVTVLFEHNWAAACAELGELEGRPWTIRRANLFVTGIGNPERAGGLLRIGPVLLEVTGETDPCSRMDAQWQGLTTTLSSYWRGGVTTRVLEGGEVKVGDGAAFQA